MTSLPAAVPAIEARQLRKTFGNEDALAPLDLVVPRGSVFALVGHNGAGKTTLIKLLLNMIEPTSGEATVLGEPAASLRGSAFTRIGYVSENQEMPEWMSVRQWMDFLRPFYPAWSEGDLLERMELPPKRKIGNLSRGMRMKAAVASVLAFRPPLIVMDEPFSGLDPLVRDELIVSLVDHLNDRDGQGSAATVLICSHDLAEIETFATHVAFLHQGRLLFAEELDRLTSRFREVTVALAEDATLPASLPEHWLGVDRGTSAVRFVHTHADRGDLEDEVRSVLPHAASIDAQPMTLRTIFLALVKSNAAPDRSRA